MNNYTKISIITLTIILSFIKLSTFSFYAAIEKYDNFYYKINDSSNSIEITKYIGHSKELYVPKTINNLPVTKINDDAFENNLDLQHLILSENISVIGRRTFGHCANLKNVIFNQNCRLKIIDDMAFYACSTLTDFTLIGSVEYVGDYSFGFCEKLNHFNIDENSKLNHWGKDVFMRSNPQIICANPTIKTLLINANIDPTKILNNPNDIVVKPDKMVFDETDTLIDPNEMSSDIYNFIFEDLGFKSVVLTQYVGNCKNISISPMMEDKTVTRLGINLFANNHNLENLIVPKDVLQIRDNAFLNCLNLKSILFDKDSVLRLIGEKAFSGCQNLIKITIPNNVILISSWAFENCFLLESVNLSPNLTHIGVESFRNCKKLKHLDLPDKLTYISPFAFVNCDELAFLDIPNNVKVIGCCAFDNCPFLTIECHSQEVKDLIIKSGFPENDIICDEEASTSYGMSQIQPL